MPTDFNTSFADGDVIEPEHIQQYAPSINDLENGAAFFSVDSGSTDSYAITMDPVPPDPLPAGFMVHFQAATANTGAATLSINGQDPVALVMKGDEPLVTGAIMAGQVVAAVFDGEAFQLVGVNAPAAASTLDDLTDVSLSSPSNGQGLFYDSSESRWENRALAAGDMPSGIDAAKLADGSVSNAEFQRLDGVTSGIQSQLDGKAPSNQPVLGGPVQVYYSDGGGSFLEFTSDTFPLYSALARVGWEGGTGVVFSAGYYHMIIRTVDGDIDLQPGGTGRKASISGNKIWHEGNDGSGSGLNADMVDGKHAGNASDTVLLLPGSLSKGDILVFDGTGIVRLPVGTNGQVLTADSSETTGLKWA